MDASFISSKTLNFFSQTIGFSSCKIIISYFTKIIPYCFKIKLVEKVCLDVYNINVNNNKSEEVVKSMYKKPFINKIDKWFFYVCSFNV